jgi:signal transduction histidine kinase
LEREIKRVLVVDDEQNTCDMLTEFLRSSGYSCASATDPAKALAILKKGDFEFVISDIKMPKMDGLQLVSEILKIDPEIDTIMMTGHAGVYTYVDIIRAGASDFIAKPFQLQELQAKMERIDRERKMQRGLKQMAEELRKSRDELESRVEERTAELEKANEELRQFPSKLIAAQEEERRKLASELHDSIGQSFAAVKYWIEMALKLRDAGDCDAAINQLQQFIPILQRSIDETRNIYMGLRPTMLDDAGLLATLEWLRQECMKLYPQRHVELEVGVSEEEIPAQFKINIFRIAQEALNNIAKHSKAEWVDISLSKNGGRIELVISDDGVGMDLDLISQTSAARSLGLTSMRERAVLSGGSFSIESILGEGTTIRAFWPIETEGQFQKGETTQLPALSNF